MKKIITFAVIAIGAVAVASCAKEKTDASLRSDIVLSLGFEGYNSVTSNTTSGVSKTFLNNAAEHNPTITWSGSSGYNSNDQTVWVFANINGQQKKYQFKSGSSSSEATEETVRKFLAPETAPDDVLDHVQYVLWSGKSGKDNSKFENGVITSAATGTNPASLVVVNPQTINKFQSFEVNSNVAVMKPGDEYLKNVFGYIRFKVPTGANKKAQIKSVTFEADEYISGQIEINYSGNDPVVNIIDNELASKTLTVNTRVSGSAYEGGTLWAILPPGTYHNFKAHITPFKTEGTSTSAEVGDEFTINGGTVKVVRSKWTDAGSLPARDPSTLPNPDTFVWPTDESAFDYGVTGSKTALMSKELFDEQTQGMTLSAANTLTNDQSITIDKVTYRGKGYFETSDGGRMAIETAGYNQSIPPYRYISLKINKPGTLSFYPTYGSDQPNLVIRVALRTTKDGVVSTTELYDDVPAHRSTATATAAKQAGTYNDCVISVPVSKNILSGIDGAATLYIYQSCVYTRMRYVDITWTPAQ